MPTSIRDLLAIERFRLRLAAGADADDPRLDEPLTWAHSSDLEDPTPWLEPGQLLLLDGINFAPDASAEFCDAYVARMVRLGIRALGFATEVIHPRIPPALVAACDAQRLPLLEVRHRTPFIGIIRHVADVIAADRQAQLEHMLRAQRAIARAALRPAGVGAILAELERQLGTWVALFDASGDRVHVPTRLPVPPQAAAEVAAAAAHVLARGNRASARIDTAAGAVTLQTLGQRGTLRGVLAVGTTSPDDPLGGVLTESVIALTSIAFDQSRALDTAHRHLRTGLLELILAGQIALARSTAGRLWGGLPPDPVRAVVVTAPGSALVDELELHMRRHRGQLFPAERDGSLVVVTRHDDLPFLAALFERHGAQAGASSPARWDDLARALSEADQAAARATEQAPFATFDEIASEGIAAAIDPSDAARIARHRLAPLLDDARTLDELRTWLTHHGAWDPAARELGLHRHTLRAHVETAFTTIGLDPDRFEDRAELWLALNAVGRQGD